MPKRNPTRKDLTAEYVRRVLDYDPTTGVFHWRHRNDVLPMWNTAHAGKRTGYKDNRGYLRIRVNGVLYLAHRLAWLYMTGEWPVADIDHADLDRGNNAFANLREASSSQNMANRSAQRDNSLGIKGVYPAKGGRFSAQIRKDRKLHHLGLFDSPEAARAAYAKAAQELHGEFHRVG